MNLSRMLMESGFSWQGKTKGFCRIDDRTLAVWYKMPNLEVARAELVELAKSLLRQDLAENADPSEKGHFALDIGENPCTLHIHFATWPLDLEPVFPLSEGVH